MNYLDLINDRAEADTHGAGKHGFTEGDGSPLTRSLIRETFLNAVLREICAAIEGGGLTPSAANLTQLASVLATLRASIVDVTTEVDTVISDAGLTPSAGDDTQLLAALNTRVYARGVLSATTNETNKFGFDVGTSFGTSGFTFTGEEITVPRPGLYRVTVDLILTADDAVTNPLLPGLNLVIGGSNYTIVGTPRYSATAAHHVTIKATHYGAITTPASEKIYIQAGVAVAGIFSAQYDVPSFGGVTPSYVYVERIKG